ncbi:MAG: UvrD-helicase domain-containing protein [Bifidobacteriaceae bacterium]|jgi:DNA helicase-2/ATP-dependent DNA helicase PcrA|nr:UvrD-helicase domain-containing protein [Bifidobacteriaceae bacterium]
MNDLFTSSALPALIDLTRLPSLAPASVPDGDLDGWAEGAPSGTAAAQAQAQADRLLDGLNAEQKAAVLHRGGPLLIVAGAGSGKTRVLTRRIAYLLATGQARSSEILAITFTNKAAAEMRERVEALVGPRAKAMWVSTFHSACVRILRREAAHLNLKSTFSIYDTQDSQRLLQLCANELALDTKRFTPKKLAHRISNLKNELIDYETYSSQVSETNPVEAVTARVYALYQQRLAQAHALDFDDLIMQTVNLLQAFPDVAEHYRRRFRHILVDEYQDTNHAQYVLVRELTGVAADARRAGGLEPGELTVVGDADQSIYAFRGATIRNITEFETDYPNAATIFLNQNYRSTFNILRAANGVVSLIKGRKGKPLRTDNEDGPKVVGYVADNEHDEAQFIADEIDRLAKEYGIRPRDVAVFYRTNAQSRALEEVLVRVGLPYVVVGGTRFYERREIRDAVAYLRAAANLDDTVSVQRVFNVPKRGLGDRALAAAQAYAAGHGISFGAALAQVEDMPGLTARAVRAIGQYAHLLATLSEMAADGAGPAQILDFAMAESGYLAELQDSTDPQDASRVENLAELHAVASEFEQSTPDGTLADFLERVSLVADSDQLPPQAGTAEEAAAEAAAAAAAAEAGQVTLMTLHTAKGLEFPVVFVTGFEDGTFPHQRSFASEQELEEERRLAYVGLTRARQRLYLSRAEVRTTWGAPQYLPPSRFLENLPPEVMEWRREKGSSGALRPESWAGPVRTSYPGGGRRSTYHGPAAGREGGSGAQFGSATPRPAKDIPHLEVGDMITHDVYGLGTVVATEGEGLNAVARIQFREEGVKRILLRFAPVTKL